MSDESREDRGKPLRGFAKLTPEQRADVSAMGGRAAHAVGTAHEFTSEEAKAAAAKNTEKRRAEAKLRGHVKP